MRVLHVFNELGFSGAEKMYVAAAPLFKAKGCELFAMATGSEQGDYAPEFIKAGFEISHFPLPENKPSQIIKYLKSIRKYIDDMEIDVVHIHRASYMCWIGIGSCARLSRKSTVRTFHNVFKNRRSTWIVGWFVRWIGRHILGIKYHTIGESVYFNELNYYHNKTIKINNWYDPYMFFPASVEEKKSIRNKLDIPEDNHVIISVGACSPVKNHGDILRALPLILKQSQVLYLHLGQGRDEAEEKKQSELLGVDGNVRFVGNVVNVRDYLIASDVFVMPSIFEGLAIAAIEAMACKLPSILYDVSGLRDLIDSDNDNGFKITPDYKLIAQKCIVIFKRPDMADRMAINAYKYVSENYSMVKSVEEIYKLYAS